MRLAKITTALIAVAMLVGFSAIAIKGGAEAQELNYSTPELQSTEEKLKSVNVQYEKLNTKLHKESSSDKKTIEQLNKEKSELEKQRQDLEGQLQAKAEQKARIAEAARNAENTLTATKTASAASLPAGRVVDGCGDNSYANYIYMHESGCKTDARNSSGCLGIGQACPGSKLTAACPSLDYDCQNAFFTNYAVSRYGSWAGAYNFWINNRWW